MDILHTPKLKGSYVNEAQCEITHTLLSLYYCAGNRKF